MKPIISFDEFMKIDLRVGKIIHAEAKEGSEKLLRLKVDFGEEGERNILSGIAKSYTPEELTGKTFIFIINIPPRKMMGEESQGMILAANPDAEEEGMGKPLLLTTNTEASPGATIR